MTSLVDRIPWRAWVQQSSALTRDTILRMRVLTATAFVLAVSYGIGLAAFAAVDLNIASTIANSGDVLARREAVTLAVAGLFAPAVGVLVDRIGARAVLSVGLACLSIAMVLCAFARDPGTLALAHAFAGKTLAAAGPSVTAVLLARWFTRGRGTAIGVSVVGTAVGVLLARPLTSSLAAAYSWRTAAEVLAIVPALAVVLVLFVVRERPKDPEDATTGPMPRSPVSLTFGDALHTRVYWVLAASVATCAFGAVALKAHLEELLRSRGASDVIASTSLGLLCCSVLLGALGAGILADRAERRRVLQGCAILLFIGSLFLPHGRGVWLSVPLVVVGACAGGVAVLIQTIAVDAFGLRSAGLIVSSLYFWCVLGAVLGPLTASGIFALSGTWTLAFAGVSSLLALSMLATLGTPTEASIEAELDEMASSLS